MRNVTVYMGPRCNFCDAAKRLLKRNNIPYSEINIALEEGKKEEMLTIEEAENLLLNHREKRVKPFFDNKVQTDLNCYWLYSNLYSSLILDFINYN